MYSYTAPLRDMQFVIEDVLQAPHDWMQTPAFSELDAEISRQVLEGAGEFARDVLSPINSSGDLEGCTWKDGDVKTPDGYPEAYRAFVDGGWASLACDTDHGGQGLPMLLHAALDEMMAAANHGWTMYPGLLHGGYECLNAHGSDELKDRYLRKIASGEFLVTMNLTEPQAGSDLSQLRCKAEPGLAGAWRITGSKIFISGGEHDLTSNIVHLVLCRLPGAPAGSGGLSLVLAPKLLPDGSRNAIRCDGIEKKMGIKGSATCAMTFEGATGWLVGEPHTGLSAMFVMMNAARLHVGLQGVGHLEIAEQNARAYALERIQGNGAAIAKHPAVRRTLCGLRALVEGERLIAYWTAHLLDQSHHHPAAERRARAGTLVSLLTPIAKAFFTENGNRGANEALQVWGGYGYIHEYGIEQTVRDSRVAMLYEGTNEIQSIDLMKRHVLGANTTSIDLLMSVLDQEADACLQVPALTVFGDALRRQTTAAREAVTSLRGANKHAPGVPLLIADDLLRGLGSTLLAWAWAITARCAQPHESDPWFEQKTATAKFGVDWLLLEADWRWQRVKASSVALPNISGC